MKAASVLGLVAVVTAQQPKIQTQGPNVAITAGAGGEIMLGSASCTATSVCAQPALVANLTAQLAATNAMVQALSSTLAAMTPQSINEANGNFKLQGTWNALQAGAAIGLGTMNPSDVLKYTISMVGCNGGRSTETGTIILNQGTQRANGVVTRQPSIIATTGARKGRNIWVHLINLRSQAVGNGGRVMLWLVPGPDCNIENVASNGLCSTNPPCDPTRTPMYTVTINSVGGVTGNGTFQPVVPPATPPATYDANVALPAINKVVKQLSSVMSGTIPVDTVGNTSPDVISLGSMQVNDIVTVNVIFDACAITGATKLMIVGAPHARRQPRRFEVFGLSTERGANGLNNSIPTILDKINMYAAYETTNRAQVYLEIEPIRTNCPLGRVHKWYLESEGVKGTYLPGQVVPFNRSAAVLTPIRLLGRPADGRHPWSPAASCQELYANQALTRSGWYYIIDPLRATPSYQPAKYVQCKWDAASQTVTAWGYRRFLQTGSADNAAQTCATMGSTANLASFSSLPQYNAIVTELQTQMNGANNPNFRWWIGLQHNTSRNWGTNAGNWYFRDGARDFNVGALWAPNNPSQSAGDCVAAQLTIDTGVARGGTLNSWTQADSLSLVSASCSATPPGNLRIRGPICFGPLPLYAGAS
mmetsp:Transcript_126285/g.178228  ORF Transcript_126285/g.178228 Transcript_126285/m.178228 type:complete len:647 (-) Transcript_126285:94-2034(-)